jgi:hypothetical protein
MSPMWTAVSALITSVIIPLVAWYIHSHSGSHNVKSAQTPGQSPPAQAYDANPENKPFNPQS